MRKISQEGLIQGRVQGVGYRAFCMRCALDLGIGGYARNLPDGSVEVGAYGAPELLKTFWGRLQEGPPLSWVTGITITDHSSIGEPEHFDILF